MKLPLIHQPIGPTPVEKPFMHRTKYPSTGYRSVVMFRLL